MPMIVVRAGLPGKSQAVPVECGDAGATIANNGPNSVYFADTPDVSATLRDGVIVSGSSATLYGAQWFIVDEGPGSSAINSAALVIDEEPATSAGPGRSSIIYVDGAPESSDGLDGDTAIDSTNQILYGPKASGAWPISGIALGGTGDAAVVQANLDDEVLRATTAETNVVTLLAAEGLGVVIYADGAWPARGTDFHKYVWIGPTDDPPTTLMAANDTFVGNT
jgi:hypothetical protein